jgi:pimeloyl-ACP methyl ester carboxylesterase
MPRSMITIAIISVLIYLGLCAVLFLFQRSLIYFPQPRSLGKAAPTITLAVDGADLVITVRPHAGPHALIYFGGNAEDVSHSLASFSAAFPDYALYLAHYRGYGGSSGKPSEASLVADALALFDKVQTDHKQVVVVGRSLGSGVAVQLASRRTVERLVLVTPYDSIQKLATKQFPYFPVRWLLQDKFESWKYAPLITAPTLLIAAEEDEVIPLASSEALLKSFRDGVAALKVIPGTGHNTVSESLDYLPQLKGLQ